jgi:hypothetical protein
MSKHVRAKAGLPWPVTGIYSCDKCHTQHVGRAETIATRCAVLRGARQQPCNGAYYVLIEPRAPDERSIPTP